MKILLILNDPPYGTERSYNALRLAVSLAKRESEQSDQRQGAARLHPTSRRKRVGPRAALPEVLV